MKYSTVLSVSLIVMLASAFTLSLLASAEIFYKEDFEDGGKNWKFIGNVKVDNAKARSGNKSVLVDQGTGLGDSANLLVKMPSADPLYDIIWIYLEDAKASAGYMYLPTWTLAPGAEDWVGPHVCLRYGDGSGGVISWHSNGWFDQKDELDVGVWYKIKTVMNMKTNTFDMYYQKEGEGKEVKTIADAKFIAGRGNATGQMPPSSSNYRRIGSAFGVSAKAYYDDFILADEDAPEAVSPSGKLSTYWGRIKREF